MTQSNFCLILLMTAVVFFLVVLNNNVEPYANPETKEELDKILEGSRTDQKSMKLIDNVVSTITKNVNGANVEKSVTPTTNVLQDIFNEGVTKEADFKNVSSVVPEANSIGHYSTLDTSYANINLDNLPKGTLTSSDLVPINEKENDFNKYNLATTYEDANLAINASEKLGVDTSGSSKKNASYDLRGSMPCPKFVVSPWMNSTYEPDTNIKTLY